jgi:hypothetical protein
VATAVEFEQRQYDVEDARAASMGLGGRRQGGVMTRGIVGRQEVA